MSTVDEEEIKMIQNTFRGVPSIFKARCASNLNPPFLKLLINAKRNFDFSMRTSLCGLRLWHSHGWPVHKIVGRRIKGSWPGW